MFVTIQFFEFDENRYKFMSSIDKVIMYFRAVLQIIKVIIYGHLL